MQTMIELQVTIFSLIATGFLLRKIRLVPASFQKHLTDLVIYLILPCNIVASFAKQVHATGMWSEFLLILLISIAIQVFTFFYGKGIFCRESEDRKRCLVYGTLCSNSGFLGNPIAEGVFGAPGLILASIYLIPQRIVMWSVGLAIFSNTYNRKDTLRKVATHPCILACVIGILLMLLRIDLPAPILTPIETIGRCNTALSMLVIGMILSEIRFRSLLDKTLFHYTLQRLIIIPLLVYIVLSFLPVSPLVRGVSVLLAAMPAGATTSMLATKYNRDPHFATNMIILSTLYSIPALLIWTIILT